MLYHRLLTLCSLRSVLNSHLSLDSIVPRFWSHFRLCVISIYTSKRGKRSVLRLAFVFSRASLTRKISARWQSMLFRSRVCSHALASFYIYLRDVFPSLLSCRFEQISWSLETIFYVQSNKFSSVPIFINSVFRKDLIGWHPVNVIVNTCKLDVL